MIDSRGVALRQAYLKTRQAAEYLNLSVPLLKKLRTDGGGPQFFRVGRVYLYPVVGLDGWVRSFPAGGLMPVEARR